METIASNCWGSWGAQVVERVTLDLGIVGSSPMLGVEITENLKRKK